MTDTHALLYRAPDIAQAHRLVDALQADGIEASIAGGNQPIMFGEVGADALRSDIWVRREDLERGKQVIERSYAASSEAASSPGGGWSCPECSETNDAGFELCWSCSTEKPSS